MNSSTPVITKNSKNKIRVDYEGKLTVKERMLKKLKTSNTWVKVIINIFRFIMMLGISFVIIYPFIAKIAGSFMTPEDVIDSTVSLIPKNPTLEIYRAIFFEKEYPKAFLNTALLSLGCAVVQTFISCLVGYGLAKFKFKGNKLVMGLVVLTMVIPHGTLELAMGEHFAHFDLMTVKTWDYVGIFELITGSSLQLTNTFTPFIILSIFGLAFKNGLYIYLMRQFFKGIPDELEESAYVDGAGTIRTFFQIIIPLAVPMMITVFLFSFSWQWTDNFYTELFYVPGSQGELDTVLMPDLLEDPLSGSLMYNGAGKDIYTSVVVNTASLMIIMPLVILYLFCQKYLVQGIERSGLVG